MGNKKNILFIIPSLEAGGAEKALVNLLYSLSPKLYNIDLILFKSSGIFLKQLPEHINLVPIPGMYYSFTAPIKEAALKMFKSKQLKLVLDRLRYSRVIQKATDAAIAEQQSWKYLSQSIDKLPQQYDVAVSFLEKSSLYFLVDKVNARKKISWVHTTYSSSGLSNTFDENYFSKVDKVVGVSKACVDDLKKNFPSLTSKVIEVANLMPIKMIEDMAKDQVELVKSAWDIITVSRLSEEKGMHLLLDTAKYLKEEQQAFTWYVVGDGPMRAFMEAEIVNSQLEDKVVLLGVQDNPYKYIQWADVYCQTSKYEGKSIAIEEAKILCKPILTTNFTTVKDQIADGVNGMVAEMDAKHFGDAIIKLKNDIPAQDKLVANLLSNKTDNEGVLMQINKLFDSDKI